jgi:hypothetical protein
MTAVRAKRTFGVAKDSVTKAAASSTCAGRRRANKHRLSVDLNLPAYQKPFSKYLWLWIPAFAGMTGESFRSIYRHYRRCGH